MNTVGIRCNTEQALSLLKVLYNTILMPRFVFASHIIYRDPLSLPRIRFITPLLIGRKRENIALGSCWSLPWHFRFFRATNLSSCHRCVRSIIILEAVRNRQRWQSWRLVKLRPWYVDSHLNKASICETNTPPSPCEHTDCSDSVLTIKYSFWGCFPCFTCFTRVVADK